VGILYQSGVCILFKFREYTGVGLMMRDGLGSGGRFFFPEMDEVTDISFICSGINLGSFF